MLRLTSRRLCSSSSSAASSSSSAAGESTSAKVKRLAKEQGTAFAIVYFTVNASVVGSLYGLTLLGVDSMLIDGVDAAGRMVGYEMNLKQKLAEKSSAAREGSRWALTMAMFSVAPVAPLTFPLYIAGTIKLARWPPFARRFGSKVVPTPAK